jgi:dihydrofolate synthase/folylpolyglutamate synthase
MKNKIKQNTRWVHIAGTNGKGSTCNYIAAGLRLAGYKTGLFTSPHVLEVTERITVNGEPIPRERIPEVCEKWFQRLWKIALEYFEEQQVEYAVIETGIGGLLDCTNEINPILSVITKIGYDHMDLLGNTIEEIASHKAGIIKVNTPVVTDPTQFDGAMRIIREAAAAKGSKLYIPAEKSDNIFEQNKIVAFEALKVLGIEHNMPLHGGIGVSLPARFQTISDNPLIIVDGAHNYDAVKAVLKMIPENTVIVFGMLKTKDYNSCIKLLDGYEVVLVKDVECRDEIRNAVETAKKLSDSIFVCGSIYLAGNVIKLFSS